MAKDPHEIRAEIDTEVVKGLVVINGGGAVALLAFLPAILDKPGYDRLTEAVLWGLFLYQAGLISALIHNRLRRVCSLQFQSGEAKIPCEFFPSSLEKIKLIAHLFRYDKSCACRLNIIMMYLSVILFTAAGTIVFLAGLKTVDPLFL